MANNNANLSGTAFSGFPGGYDLGNASFIRLYFLNKKKYRFYLVPGVGNVAPATVGTATMGTSGISTLGANLPHVDPNTFQGTVHWGPDQVMTGAQAGQLPFGGAATGFGTGSI